MHREGNEAVMRANLDDFENSALVDGDFIEELHDEVGAVEQRMEQCLR